MTKVIESKGPQDEGRDLEIELTATIAGEEVVIREKLPEAPVEALPEPEVVKTKKGKGSSKPKAKPAKDPVVEPVTAPAEPKGKPRKKRQPTGGATLAQLKEGYVLSLEEEGKSGGTIASYAAEMDLALGILGAESKLADLSPKQVQRFFDHERVTKLRSGKEKSQLSIDKSRRVFRQALLFAAENGWVEQAPLPVAAKPEAKGKKA